MGTFRQVIRASRLLWVAVFVCSMAAGAPLAVAQTGGGGTVAPSERKAKQKRRKGPNREGEYGGIVPERDPAADDRRRKQRKRKNAISWVGFQPWDGGRARLFVRLANELEYTQNLVGSALYVNIARARYRHKNTRRRLDMRHFDTALELVTGKRVSARRARKNRPARKRGIELRITFKDAKDAREASASMTTGKDGYTYLNLDFPPGSGSSGGGGGITISDPEGE